MLPPETFPGIRHPAPPPHPILLWDGQCGFCAASVRCFRRLARRPAPDAPVQLWLASLPEPARVTALQQVLYLQPDGTLSGGVRALRHALKDAGRPRLAALLAHPVVYPFARGAYRLTARFRRLWPSAAACPR